MLSRIAQKFAAEIAAQDWSDAPWRLDSARHDRATDGSSKTEKQLSDGQAECIRINVMWVTAQALVNDDPNLDLHEYALACGVPRDYVFRSDGKPSGSIIAGIREFAEGYANADKVA